MSKNPGSPSKPLTDYPRPSVAVDVAVLTVIDETVKVLVVDHPRGRALPGTFLHPGERLADAARRALHDKAGFDSVEFHQMAMLDDPERDDRGWVLSMAHNAVVPFERFPTGAQSVAVADTGILAFDTPRSSPSPSTISVAAIRRRSIRRVDRRRVHHPRTAPPVRGDLRAPIPEGHLPTPPVTRPRSNGRTQPRRVGRPAELYRKTHAPLLPGAAPFLWNRSG